jgi:hypothetical protein
MYLIALLTAILYVIFSEGIGQWICKRLNINARGFTAPYGAAAVFAILELFYLPRLIRGGSFDWIKGSTVIVLIICVVCVCITFRQNIKSLFRARSIYVILSALLLAVLFWLGQQSINISADSELLLMVSNVNTDMIRLGSLRLQGYELFGSFVVWSFSGNSTAACLMLGLYANMIAVMMILNIVDSFEIKNPWFRFTLILCSVFYCQFYSWKITGSFHGANWRLIFTALTLFTVYTWLKRREENIKYLIPLVITAGLATNNGFFMISVEILYCVAIWLFRSKKIRTLYDLMTFAFPVMIYFSCWLGRRNGLAGWLMLLFSAALIIIRRRRFAYHRIIQIEDFLIDYSRQIFYIGVPLVFLIGTFILRFFVPGYGIEYSHYIRFFSETPIKSYIFLSGSWIDNILDVFRWGGVLFFLIKAFKPEDTCIRAVWLGMVIFFINPLCMGMLSQIVGLNAYAYAFEIIFNPFTDVMIFWWIYRQFEWTVVGQWILELTLIFAMVFGHVTSFTNSKTGLYTDLLDHDPKTGMVIIP